MTTTPPLFVLCLSCSLITYIWFQGALSQLVLSDTAVKCKMFDFDIITYGTNMHVIYGTNMHVIGKYYFSDRSLYFS